MFKKKVNKVKSPQSFDANSKKTDSKQNHEQQKIAYYNDFQSVDANNETKENNAYNDYYENNQTVNNQPYNEYQDYNEYQNNNEYQQQAHPSDANEKVNDNAYYDDQVVLNSSNANHAQEDVNYDYDENYRRNRTPKMFLKDIERKIYDLETKLDVSKQSETDVLEVLSNNDRKHFKGTSLLNLSLDKILQTNVKILELTSKLDKSDNFIEIFAEVEEQLTSSVNVLLKSFAKSLSTRLDEIDDKIIEFDKKLDKNLNFVLNNFNMEIQKIVLKQTKSVSKFNDEAAINYGLALSKLTKANEQMQKQQKQIIESMVESNNEILNDILKQRVEKFDEYALNDFHIRVLKWILTKEYINVSDLEDNDDIVNSLNYLHNLSIISFGWRDDIQDLPVLVYWVDKENSNRIRTLLGRWEYMKFGKSVDSKKTTTSDKKTKNNDKNN